MENLYQIPDPWKSDSFYNQKKRKKQLNLISKCKHDKILEVGCGEGFLTKELAKICKTIDAIDISQNAILRAKKYCQGYKNIRFCCKNFINFKPCKTKYDIILLSEVFGYFLGELSFLDVGFLLERIIKSLKKKGVLIFVNTILHKKGITSEDKIVYYKWARQAYYTILKEMDMKIVYNKQFRGVKNNDLRKYEIIIFQK